MEEGQAQEIEIHLDVDKTVVLSQKVRLFDKGYDRSNQPRIIFPANTQKKAVGLKLVENLTYQWKFKKSSPPSKFNYKKWDGLKNQYEIRQVDSDVWWPGWLDNETNDGKF